jgi:hypothetical protein
MGALSHFVRVLCLTRDIALEPVAEEAQPLPDALGACV